MGHRGFTTILLLTAVVIVGVAGFFIYKKTRLTNNIPNNTSDTKDWKDYTNETYKISFNYPSDYKFEESSLDVGVVAWMGSLESPRNIVSEDTKIWDVYTINVAVRRRMGLSLDEWVDNECGNKIKSKNNLEMQGRKAVEVLCSFGSTNDNQIIVWKIIAIDNGDNYIYTLTNNAYQRNQEIDITFDKIVPTFKFVQ